MFHTAIGCKKSMYTGTGPFSKDHNMEYFMAAQIDNSYVTKKKLNSDFFRFRKDILIVIYTSLRFKRRRNSKSELFVIFKRDEF